MQTLLQTLQRLLDRPFLGPITSAQVLAAVGFLALVATVFYLMQFGTARATAGTGQILTGCVQLVLGLAVWAAAMVVAWVTVRLTYEALQHMLRLR
jgi:hypothetical protein